MNFTEFIKTQLKIADESETNINDEIAASILFELKRQESETNSNYALALAAVVDLLRDSEYADVDAIAEKFDEIMNDENDHAAAFNAMASRLLGLRKGDADE